MFEMPVEMARGVAIGTNVELGRALLAGLLLIPSGAVEPVAIAPSRHLAVELGAEHRGYGCPGDLVAHRHLEILAQPRLALLVGLLGLGHEPQRPAGPAPGGEVLTDRIELGLESEIEGRQLGLIVEAVSGLVTAAHLAPSP